jgi:hypothetical protein
MFDLIVGASTGAIIAMLLGNFNVVILFLINFILWFLLFFNFFSNFKNIFHSFLGVKRQSVGEAKKTYLRVSTKLFKSSRFENSIRMVRESSYYNSKEWIKILKEVHFKLEKSCKFRWKFNKNIKIKIQFFIFLIIFKSILFSKIFLFNKLLIIKELKIKTRLNVEMIKIKLTNTIIYNY